MEAIPAGPCTILVVPHLPQRSLPWPHPAWPVCSAKFAGWLNRPQATSGVTANSWNDLPTAATRPLSSCCCTATARWSTNLLPDHPARTRTRPTMPSRPPFLCSPVKPRPFVSAHSVASWLYGGPPIESPSVPRGRQPGGDSTNGRSLPCHPALPCPIPGEQEVQKLLHEELEGLAGEIPGAHWCCVYLEGKSNDGRRPGPGAGRAARINKRPGSRPRPSPPTLAAARRGAVVGRAGRCPGRGRGFGCLAPPPC